jgi:hypothetical protein
MSKKTYPLLSLTAENRSKIYLLRYKSLFKGSKFRSLSMLFDSDLHSQYGSGSRAAKWMRFRYLLLILTIVNMYSYAIVLFQLENLRTSISGTRQRISEVLGMMTTVGSMRPSLTTTSFKLAVWTPDWLRGRTHTGRTFRCCRSGSGYFFGNCSFRQWPSRCQQKIIYFVHFLVTFWRNIYIWISHVVAKKAYM